jgi:flavodoxin
MLNYERMEMGNPRCIAPLIAALLQYGLPMLLSAGGSLGAAAMQSSATGAANAQNQANAKEANAIQNQQWGVEMGLKRQQMDMDTKKQFEDWLNQVPARQKNFIDMWSGGR